ncbi:hypothetical protein DEU56DRAFT_163968 [Suillus clintonianus]|uniref:uncharacterized protein n=1 Tax=Suillus clintonianus TaxID=1904413 RepID=UPI001B86EF9B|nr:uncharacterized protein DEU56DRAFT_163968 [Suillus clintonianus]KAG2116798.1 hypothetical protein DEU56DRAFT_163968 [Suillus clintonianus]
MSPLLGRCNFFLERRFPLRSRRSQTRVSFRALSKCVAADQLIWKVWPVAQMIYFRYMPLPYRIPFQSAERQHPSCSSPVSLHLGPQDAMGPVGSQHRNSDVS